MYLTGSTVYLFQNNQRKLRTKGLSMLSEHAEEEAVKHQERAYLRVQRQNKSTVRSCQCERTNVLVILEICINSRTGTDGRRVLCHQFSTSSLSLLGYYTKRCSTCWLRMNQLGKAILLFSSTDDQVCWLLVASVGQNTPVRTSHAVSCSLLIPHHKSTISSIKSLIFTKR